MGTRSMLRGMPPGVPPRDPQRAEARASEGVAALGARRDPAASKVSGSDRSLDRAAPWILAALLALGALLRLIDLGQLSFRWDEDLSSLAAKAIAEHGIPELPSGMVYLRSLPFLYVLAGSGMLFGFDEWSLRLPAALFGIATIALGYFFGKRFFGTGVGLVVAALLTFSAWDIEFARYARMYAPFTFFYVLTLLSIWRFLVVERSTEGGILCLLLAWTALLLHDLAYTLALAFLLPLLIDGRQTLEQPRRSVLPLIGFGSVTAAFFVWGRIQSHYFDRAALLAAERGAADPSAVPADVALRTLESAAGGDGGPLGLLRRIVAQVRLPDLPAFASLADTVPLAAAGIPIVTLAAAAAFVAIRRHALQPAAWVMLPLIGLLCGFQLFNLALLATTALAFVRREGVRAFRAPEVVFAAALIALSFAAWLAAIVGLDLLGVDGGIRATAKEAIKELLNYPSFFVVWGFPREYPLTSLAALLGGLWAFERIAKPEPDRAALFVVAAFAFPILLNGMFETRYQNFRYDVPFGTLFFTFVALGVLKWPELVGTWRAADDRLEDRRAPSRGLVLAGTALIAVLIAAYDLNPLKSWLVTSRDYSSPEPLYAFFDLRGFRDFRTAAAYVDARADADDALVTFDCREYYNYLDRMDYCIVSGTYRDGDELIQTYVDDGVIRDLYVGSTILFDVDDLERVLEETPGDVWFLASDSIFDEGRYPEDVLEFLAARQRHVVHVARDGMTKVYRF
ncbi:MAG TPA: glycosyltransferase family 39 protein [Gammaproteobacteria bacterium]